MMKKLQNFSLFLGLLFTPCLYAGNPLKLYISAAFTDDLGNPLSGVSVQITNPCETEKTRMYTLDSNNVDFTALFCREIHLICTKNGFDTLSHIVRFEADSTFIFNGVLSHKSDKISEVEISVSNSAVSIKGDKIVVDAEKISPGAAATALDLLMRCPGVFVDEQNNIIRLRGNAAIVVMVNDRLQPLRGEDLIQWLRSLPATAVDKIELISNPSARYDAAGSAGIINLKMAKNKRQGLNGNISSSAGQGRYGKLSEGFTLNYGAPKVSYGSMYNFAMRKGFNQLHLQRDFFVNDSFIGAYQQRNYLRFPMTVHTFRGNADMQFNKKMMMGVGINSHANAFNPNGKNYSNVIDQNGQIASYFSTINNSKDRRYNGSANFYLKSNLDTLGSTFSADFDLARFRNQSEQLFTTEYFDQTYAKNAPDYLLAGDQKSELNIAAFKTDWVKQFRNKGQLESGIKASDVLADNNLKFYDRSQGGNELDSGKSNHFIYRENILAAYIQGAKKWKGLNWQAGCRYEHTFATGKQWVHQENFSRNYGQLFPSFSIQRISKKNNISGITISRRIDRPGYNDLNPFKFYLDPTTYRVGNPLLNPQLTWNSQLQFVHAHGTTFTLGLNRTTRLITEVIYPSESDPKITIQTNKNLKEFYSSILSASHPLQLGKKSSGFWSANFGYQWFGGNIANSPIGKGSAVLIINGSQNFILSKNWNADINAMFQSGQVYAYMRLKALGHLGFGVQKYFWERTGNLRFSVNDIFYTANPKATNKFVGYTESFVVKRETQVAMLSFTWRFGNPQTPQRRRPGGAEEEKQRAQDRIG